MDADNLPTLRAVSRAGAQMPAWGFAAARAIWWRGMIGRGGKRESMDSTAGPGEARWDFFISYAMADSTWAEWMAWELEEAGCRILIQGWDFIPGSHWMAEMENGVRYSERTIAVLSRAYLGSVYGQAQWQLAHRADPHGFHRRLIPVRIEQCDQPGLLGGIVSLDLFDLGQDEARTRLLELVRVLQVGRAKPGSDPGFPVSPAVRAPEVISSGIAPPALTRGDLPAFPGPPNAAAISSADARRPPSTAGPVAPRRKPVRWLWPVVVTVLAVALVGALTAGPMLGGLGGLRDASKDPAAPAPSGGRVSSTPTSQITTSPDPASSSSTAPVGEAPAGATGPIPRPPTPIGTTGASVLPASAGPTPQPAQPPVDAGPPGAPVVRAYAESTNVVVVVGAPGSGGPANTYYVAAVSTTHPECRFAVCDANTKTIHEPGSVTFVRTTCDVYDVYAASAYDDGTGNVKSGGQTGPVRVSTCA